MVSFFPDFSNLAQFANLFSSAGGRSSQSLSKVEVNTQTQTGLSIVTAEGDKVTLSTSASFQGIGVTYNVRGVAEGQAISLRSDVLEGAFLSQKQITIEGDLNEQEIQDIKKIVNQVNGLRQDVVSGDLNAIVANGQQISATGTIARVDLHIQHSESILVEQTSLRHNQECPAYPTGAISNEVPGPPGPVTSLLGFLEGLFKPKGSNTQLSEGNPSAKNPDPSQTQQKEIANGLIKFLNSVGEIILKVAHRIAELANRLNEKVEKQSDKIAESFEQLSNAMADGKARKADHLRNKIDRQINRLENTTDRVGSKIERTADKLTDVIGSLTDRLAQSGLPEGEASSDDTSILAEPSTTTEAPTFTKQT
jgi:hypothetical protein